MKSAPTPSSGIVFDLDGTLVDSRREIARACNQMLESWRRGPLPLETISGFVGDGARPLVIRALQAAGVSPDDAEVERALQLFLDRYAADPTGNTTLMPGAREALDALSGVPLALCTNKSRRTTLPVLEGLDLARYFSEIVCGDDLARNKPDPLPLTHLGERLALAPRALVMVGDGPQDVECGRAAGAYTVGVKGGVLPLERLRASRPDRLIDTLHELPELVRQAPWR